MLCDVKCPDSVSVCIVAEQLGPAGQKLEAKVYQTLQLQVTMEHCVIVSCLCGLKQPQSVSPWLPQFCVDVVLLGCVSKSQMTSEM